MAFTTDATDVVAGDGDGVADVVVRDHELGATELISADLVGDGADGPSGQPRLSADAGRVAFASEATDLVAEDGNGVADVFVRDRVAGTTALVSVADDGAALPWPSGSWACIGPDHGCVPAPRGLDVDGSGSLVAFVSLDPATERSAVLVRDTVERTTTPAVVAPSDSGIRYEEVALAADGSRVAVTAHVPGDGAPARRELHVVDLVGGGTVAVAATDGPTTALQPSLDDDGGQVAFLSDEPLVPEHDAPGVRDVDAFVVEVAGGAVERVSVGVDGGEVDDGVGDLSLSGDGVVVAWSSASAGGPRQTFVRDRGAAVTRLGSTASGAPADADAVGVLSGDGRVLALATAAGNLVSGDGGAPSDVVVRRALVPTLLGSAEVEAGAAGVTVELAGVGLDADVRVHAGSFDVRVDDVEVLGRDRLAVTVTTMPGAALGPRRLVVAATGPFGLGAAVPCECLELTWPYEAPTTPPSVPSFVIVNTDDQRFDSIPQMPAVDGRDGWARFSASYVHEPMCCPSRATLLTGQLGFRNQVLTLRDGALLDGSATLATMLDDAGYRTHLAGKYLNGYPWTSGGEVRQPPGWDDVVAFVGRSAAAPPEVPAKISGYPYLSYVNAEHGELVTYGTDPWDYSTDRYASATRQFLRSTDPDEPFLAYLAPIAPHFRVRPADRHRGSCAGQEIAPRPNVGAWDTASEPDWMGAALPQSPEQMAREQLATCEALRGVDEAVASLLVELEAGGRLDSTYVIVTSDNGYAFGEHRLAGKGHLYEESVRVPLLVLGPDVVPGVVDRLTTNSDVAATVLELAGVEPPPGHVLDGLSFLDDLRGTGEVPDPEEVLLIGCRTGKGAGDVCGGNREPMGFALGLRTARYKYVEYLTSGDRQLFDLVLDPYELTNLVDDPGHAGVLADHEARLAARTADVGVVRGRVLDDVTGAPVPGALVQAGGSAVAWRWTAQTDALGRFALPPLPPGAHPVRFSDPAGRYATELHLDATTEAAATPVVVVGGATAELTARLAPVPEG